MDFNVQVQWQPVDSQRLLLWAGRFGKQEAYMSALGRRHFEERQSASHRSTLLEAAKEAGLDVEQAEAFLNTDGYWEHVWRSYHETIFDKKIEATSRAWLRMCLLLYACETHKHSTHE